jgi:hypothetical protein
MSEMKKDIAHSPAFTARRPRPLSFVERPYQCRQLVLLLPQRDQHLVLARLRHIAPRRDHEANLRHRAQHWQRRLASAAVFASEATASSRHPRTPPIDRRVMHPLRRSPRQAGQDVGLVRARSEGRVRFKSLE